MIEFLDRYHGQVTGMFSGVSSMPEASHAPKDWPADPRSVKRIVRESPIPVIADIHFNASLALKAIEAGVAAVRINPGNIGGPDKVELVVRAAKKAGIPMRIGANSGSLPKHLAELAQAGDPFEALGDPNRREILRLIRLRTVSAVIKGKAPGPEASIRKAICKRPGATRDPERRGPGVSIGRRQGSLLP